MLTNCFYPHSFFPTFFIFIYYFPFSWFGRCVLISLYCVVQLPLAPLMASLLTLVCCSLCCFGTVTRHTTNSHQTRNGSFINFDKRRLFVCHSLTRSPLNWVPTLCHHPSMDGCLPNTSIRLSCPFSTPSLPHLNTIKVSIRCSHTRPVLCMLLLPIDRFPHFTVYS